MLLSCGPLFKLATLQLVVRTWIARMAVDTMSIRVEGGEDYVRCAGVYSGTLYCGHLGDLVKCPVYSGTPLLWTPWGPGEVSCIEGCPHFRGKFI